MSKTLNDYSVSVQKIVDTTSSSDVGVINEEIKNVYQDVLHQTHKYIVGTTVEEQTAVVGQANYSTTTDFMEIYSVYWKKVGGSDFTKLSAISEQDYLDNYINLDNSTPSKYYVKGLNVYLNPAPDEAGTLKIVYIPVATDLETSTDVSILPDRFAKVIVYGAASKFLAFEKDPAADAYERYYLNALADMVNELKTNYEPLKLKFSNRRRYTNDGMLN